jgi:hypothetical protein
MVSSYGGDMDQKTVKGDPTKGFFVHTITRDISLEDCVLDLIDNSLDGAKRLLGHPEPHLEDGLDMSDYRVEIAFSKEKFSIADNCGGISLTEAVKYAFTFGRQDEDAPESYSIGLYGIGMKRAIFKMGQAITIHSTFAGDENEPAVSFKVPISVSNWRRSAGWDFDLEDADPLPAAGVVINVSELYESIATEFSNPRFEEGLRGVIARDYSQFLSKGFAVIINGRPVRPYQFTFLQGAGFAPFRQSFKLMGVDIEIAAGVAAPPSASTDPDEDGINEDRSGWYVICNGRIVLAADKSELSGWGVGGKARWHPQYRGFVGLILFSAQSAAQLPLTTTKRSIDKESPVYRLALVRMMEITQRWIEYTNQRKLNLPEARKLEAEARPAPLAGLQQNRDVLFPKLNAVPQVREIVIQYPKPADDIRKLAAAMGKPRLSAREVGARSFDFAFRELGGDAD